MTLPLPILRQSGDVGVFDHHLLAPDKALPRLDGVAWRQQRRVARPSPRTAARDLLHPHVIGSIGFSQATEARKRTHPNPALARAIGALRARPQSAHAEPAIDGNRFTDTREHPGRIAVGGAVIDAALPLAWSRVELGITLGSGPPLAGRPVRGLATAVQAWTNTAAHDPLAQRLVCPSYRHSPGWPLQAGGTRSS